MPRRQRRRRTVVSRSFTGWPWRRRPNPSPKADPLFRPRWVELRRGGVWNANVRKALRGKAGVYMVREASRPATVLYVGESHSPSPKYPDRFWKTIKRHFSDPSGKFEYAHTTNGRPTEWVHRGNHDLEIALFCTPPSKARELEGRAILEYEPLHVKGYKEDASFDPSEFEAA